MVREEGKVDAFDSRTESMARRVARGLSKIGVAIRSRAWKESVTHRITPLQRQTLAVLRTQPKQVVTITAVAEELAVTLPTASEVIRTLENKGLIRKRRSADDGRVVTVRLTAKGKRKTERNAGAPGFLAAAVSQLSRAEQEALLRAVTKIIHHLHEHGDLPIVHSA